MSAVAPQRTSAVVSEALRSTSMSSAREASHGEGNENRNSNSDAAFLCNSGSFKGARLLDLGNGTIARLLLDVIGKHLAVQRLLGRIVTKE